MDTENKSKQKAKTSGVKGPKTTAKKDEQAGETKGGAEKEPAANDNTQEAAQTHPNASNGTLPSVEANYIVQVRIEDVGDPPVTRLLSLPPNFTFDKVHEVLQIAFNWTDCHNHSFHVWPSDFKGMKLNGIPCTPDLLNIQSGLCFDEEEARVMEEDITLATVYEDPRWGGKAAIGYEYDHGDSWIHRFILLGRASPDMNAQINAPEVMKVLCLGGEGHHVAEDCGGLSGWEDLKEAFRKGKKSDPDDTRGWYNSSCLNGGDGKKFDKYSWDVFGINEQLAKRFASEVLNAPE